MSNTTTPPLPIPVPHAEEVDQFLQSTDKEITALGQELVQIPYHTLTEEFELMTPRVLNAALSVCGSTVNHVSQVQLRVSAMHRRLANLIQSLRVTHDLQQTTLPEECPWVRAATGKDRSRRIAHLLRHQKGKLAQLEGANAEVASLRQMCADRLAVAEATRKDVHHQIALMRSYSEFGDPTQS